MINWRSNYAFTLHREDNSRWEASAHPGQFPHHPAGWHPVSGPASSHKGEVTVINALFTATSAISVTGLGVVDTGTAFTCRGRSSC